MTDLVEAIWQHDKSLLKPWAPNLAIDWEGKKPSSSDFVEITYARGRILYDAPQAVEVQDAFIRKLIARLKKELSGIWNAELIEEPVLEIVTPGVYKRRVEEEQRLEKCLETSGVPSSISLFPRSRLLLIPQQYAGLKPRSEAEGGVRNPMVVQRPWNRPYLEESICSMLSLAFFHQLRGEWGRDYERCQSAMQPEYATTSRKLGEVLAQYANELMTLNGHPDWGLDVIADKIEPTWRTEAILNYAAVFSQRIYTTAQLAMIDKMVVEHKPNLTFVPMLDSNHPFHERKAERLERTTKIAEV